MSGLAKLTKDELKLVAEDIGLLVTEGAKKIDLKRLIEESEVYKKESEFVKDIVDQLLEEKRNRKSEQEIHFELEKIKYERIKAELQLAQLRADSENTEKSSNCEGEKTEPIDVLIKSIRTLTIKVPNKSEGWGLFFSSLERAFLTKNVSEKFKAEILLNLLGEKATNVISYIGDNELSDYDKIKKICQSGRYVCNLRLIISKESASVAEQNIIM